MIGAVRRLFGRNVRCDVELEESRREAAELVRRREQAERRLRIVEARARVIARQ
jgi:hypothetical protein